MRVPTKSASSLPLAPLLLAGLLGLPACGGGGSSGGLPPLELGEADPGGPDFDGDGLSDEVEIRGWLYAVDLEGYGVDSLVHLVAKSNYKDMDGDTDNDEIGDRTEFQLRLNPSNRDTDLDGLTDRQEIQIWQTKPASVDTDGDARGTSGNLTAEPRLFDGNETRLLCDGEDADPSLCRHLGTSPTLDDTDGDGRTDYKELDEPGRSPLIAEMPLCKVELVGEIDVRLNVEYAESLGTNTEYSTSIALSTSTSLTETSQSTHTGTVEATFDPQFGWPAALLPDEIKVGYSYGYTSSTQTTSAQETVQESSRLQADSRERTETASSGRISMGVQLTNTSDVTFELENFALALLNISPAIAFGEDSASDAFKTLGTLRPDDAVGSFILGPGEVIGPIAITAEDVNADVIKEFMARPDSLAFVPVDLNLLDAEGRNLDFLTEVTERRTAKVEISFPDGRSLRSRVATNGRRTDGGGLLGLTVRESLEEVLGLDYATWGEGAQLRSLDGFEGEEQTLNDPLRFPYWSVILTSDRFSDEDPNPSRFEDLVLLPGDELKLALIQDEDSDGLADILENQVSEGDSDEDGLTDLVEFRGWDITLDGETRHVASHLSLKDTDGDGLTDDLEFGLTDPTRTDTDEDGLLDGEDEFPLTKAIVLYVDAAATGTGTPNGLSWNTAHRTLSDAVANLRARNATLIGTDEVSEVWVARGDYAADFGYAATLRVDRVRLYGGFQGGETKRGQRTSDPLLGGTVISAGAEVGIAAKDVVVDGFLFDGIGTYLNIIDSGSSLGDSKTIRNCLFNNCDWSGSRDVGALYLEGRSQAGSPFLVEDCQFVNTDVSRSDLDAGTTFKVAGGAIAARQVRPLLVRRCLFQNNSSGKYGGAICDVFVTPPANPAIGSNITVQNSRFFNNRAGLSGGAIWCGKGSTLNLSHCEFLENKAWLNGGAVELWEAKSNIVDTLFLGNGADETMFPPEYSLLRNPINSYYWPGRAPFPFDNETQRFGGAISNDSGELNMVNCTVVKNYCASIPPAGRDPAAINAFAPVTAWGAGVAHLVHKDQRVTSAGYPGGGPTGYTNIANTILWGNFGTDNWDPNQDFYSLRRPAQVGEGYAFKPYWVQQTEPPDLYGGNPSLDGLNEGLVNYGAISWFQNRFFGHYNLVYVWPASSVIKLIDCVVQNDLLQPVAYWRHLAPSNEYWHIYFHETPLVGQDTLDLNDCKFVSLTPAIPEDVGSFAEGLFITTKRLGSQEFSGDLRLKEDSPCLNQGSEFVDIDPFTPGTQFLRVGGVDWYFGGKLNGRFAPVDLDKKPRFVGGVPGSSLDLGAYERQQ